MARILQRSDSVGQCSSRAACNSDAVLNRLTRLENITIKGKTLPAVENTRDDLVPLNAKLSSLSFTPSSCVQEHAAEKVDECHMVGENHRCTMIIQSIGILRLPSYLNLEHLHLDHCEITARHRGTQSGAGVFARLSCLRILHINYCCASLNSQPVEWNLDLAGCSDLQILQCSCSNICALNLSGCCVLETLICSNNHLVNLNLSECERLRHTQCKFNSLVEIRLSPTASLDHLSCAGHDQQVAILGGLMIFELECTSLGATIRLCFFVLRQRLVRLSISDESAMGLLSEFQDLKFLRCCFRQLGGNFIDLKGCSNVELDVQDRSENCIILGRENVQKLTLNKFGMSMPYLTRLTCLQELHLTLSHGGMGFWADHRAVRKLALTISPDAGPSALVVGLSNCSMLEELSCDNCSTLSDLYLLGCVGLKSLSCTNSNLKCIDVSSSPLLTFLNVSGSTLLKRVWTCKLDCAVNIISEGCAKLSDSCLKQDLRHLTQQEVVAQRSVSSRVDAPACRDLARESLAMLLCIVVPVLLGYIIYVMGGIRDQEA